MCVRVTVCFCIHYCSQSFSFRYRRRRDLDHSSGQFKVILCLGAPFLHPNCACCIKNKHDEFVPYIPAKKLHMNRSTPKSKTLHCCRSYRSFSLQSEFWRNALFRKKKVLLLRESKIRETVKNSEGITKYKFVRFFLFRRTNYPNKLPNWKLNATENMESDVDEYEHCRL